MITVRFYPPAARIMGLADTDKTLTLQVPFREGMTPDTLHEALYQICPDYIYYEQKGRDYMENEVLTVADHLSIADHLKSRPLKDGCVVEFMPVYRGG